jgi:hypothetical protein
MSETIQTKINKIASRLSVIEFDIVDVKENLAELDQICKSDLKSKSDKIDELTKEINRLNELMTKLNK